MAAEAIANAGCCPPGSWGASKPSADYVLKGRDEKIGSLPGYVVRPAAASSASKNKAVVVFADIFGLDSGRTRAICDDYCERLNCLVIMPDFLNGDYWKESWGMPNAPVTNLLWFFPWAIRSNTNKIMKEFKANVSPFLERAGINSFGCVSFCYGACGAAAVCSLPGAKGHVGFHPSYQVFGISWGPSKQQTLSQIKCAQLYLVAHKDVVQPGDDTETIVRDNAKQEVQIKLYDAQRHGWVNRGDVAITAVQGDIEKALLEGEEFLKKQLIGA